MAAPAKALDNSKAVKYLVLTKGQKQDDFVNELRKRPCVITQISDSFRAEVSLTASPPDLLLIQLYYNTRSIVTELTSICQKARSLKIPVIVTATHTTEYDILACIGLGVSDFVLLPCDAKVLVERIDYQLSKRQIIDTETLSASSHPLFKVVSDCMSILGTIPDPYLAIRESLKAIAAFTSSPRTNIIAGTITHNDALVLASSDQDDVRNLHTTLEKYPEVREALMKNVVVYIEDITRHDLTNNIKKNVKSINIESILVLPIHYKAETIATLHIRLSEKNETFHRYLPVLVVAAASLGPYVAELRE